MATAGTPKTQNPFPLKALAQLVAAVAAAVIPTLTDDRAMNWPEYVNIGILAASAAQVYITTNHQNHPVWKYSKAITSALAIVGVVVVSTFGEQGVNNAELAQIIVALVGTGGVLGAPRDTGMADAPYGRHARRDQ